MKSRAFRFRKICIFPETVFKELIIDFFIELRRKYGIEITLITPKKEDSDYYYGKYGNSIREYISSRKFLEDVLQETTSSEESILLKAQEIEEKFGSRIMHHVITDRHLGRGYAFWAPYFPRSVFSKKANYWRILEGISAQYEFFEDVFKRNEIDLVIGGSKIVADVCRHLDICQRYLAPYKYKSYAYWGVNEFWESDAIRDVYLLMDSTEIEPDTEPHMEYTGVIQRTSRKKLLHRVVFDISYMVMRRLYHKVRGYEKARGYLLKDEIAYSLRFWWRLRRIERFTEVTAKDLGSYEFLFFPLHLEPERATTTFSPEFFDQMFAILSISKELPAGKFLVVKEHLYSIPVRPKHFYRQLKELHNVLIANPFDLSSEYIKKSIGVVALTGTAGFEAAITGKPVISFGQHNLYNILPHVYTVKGWNEVPKALSFVFSSCGGGETQKRKEDGSRFIKAFMEISANLSQDGGRAKDSIYEELEHALMITIDQGGQYVS